VDQLSEQAFIAVAVADFQHQDVSFYMSSTYNRETFKMAHAAIQPSVDTVQ
jgi:hypothetical protein